jgi:hypothetical protein
LPATAPPRTDPGADRARLPALRRHQCADLDLLPAIVERGQDLVIAGPAPTIPLLVERLVETAIAGGASGLTNEPFVAIYGPGLRGELEAAGYGSGEVVPSRRPRGAPS